MKGRVLSVASECVPLIKTGGLADVVGALPGALAAEGWDMRVLLPAYPGLAEKVRADRVIWETDDLFGGRGRVLSAQVEGIWLYLLEAGHLFDRPGGVYSVGGRDHADNPERFAALSYVGAALAREGGADGWQADILHAHDWQAGFAPTYLAAGAGAGARRVRSVMTIHNMAFQGIAPADRLSRLRLPPGGFTPEGFEYYGNISSLKAGLVAADRITTVSPTYAEELMRPEFGMGLQGVIRARAGVLSGILNGVDLALWSPQQGEGIVPYSAQDPSGKVENRARLLAEFGLGAVPGPLAIVVSRLTDQKGIDILAGVLEGFVQGGGGLVVLGSGDGGLEAAMQGAAARWPDRVGVRIGYDEALSRRMFAGGDAVLVPSRFEPCGLTQMYGLRFGTIPVVAATGGLNDTVIGATAASLAAGAATGITFHPVDGTALAGALRRLCQLHGDRKTWKAMMRRAMKTDVGWGRAACEYSALYAGLMGQ